jgi:hypothetical protein
MAHRSMMMRGQIIGSAVRSMWDHC